jgi:hypothetical protein
MYHYGEVVSRLKMCVSLPRIRPQPFGMKGGGGINREFSIMNYYVFPISPTNLFDMTSTTDLSDHVVQV